MKGAFGTGDSGRERTCFNIAYFSCFSIWPNCRPCLIFIHCGLTNGSILPVFAAGITLEIRRFRWIRRYADLVEDQLGSRPNGPIRLLAHLKYFGHCFNPASFYYCYDPADTRVETIVVEIHNTPWRERHCYVLGAEQNEHPVKHWRRHQMAKSFHVSPFIDMDIHYDWRFREPGDSLRVHMIDYQGEEKLFDASLALYRREITRSSLTRVLLRYPMMTGKVIAMIYWQALRLILKRTPFFSHPKKRDPIIEGDPK